MSNDKHRRSFLADLVCECDRMTGIPFATENEDFVHYSLSRIDIGEKEAATLGRPCGRYSSIFFGYVCDLDAQAFSDISAALGRELESMAHRLTGKGLSELSVLVAGLGNPDVDYDSFGARCCELTEPRSGLAVFGVGVPSVNGLASSDLLRCVVGCAGAELVILLDSLVAKSEARVGRVIQIAESGVRAGSGVGNHIDKIDRDTLGVPVISVGLPTALALDEEYGAIGYLAVSPDSGAIAVSGAKIFSESMDTVCSGMIPCLEQKHPKIRKNRKKNKNSF